MTLYLIISFFYIFLSSNTCLQQCFSSIQFYQKTHQLYSFGSMNSKTKQDSFVLYNIFRPVLVHIYSSLDFRLGWFCFLLISVTRTSSNLCHFQINRTNSVQVTVLNQLINSFTNCFFSFLSFSFLSVSITVASCVLFLKLHLLAQNSLE